jgi:hypothetical protein
MIMVARSAYIYIVRNGGKKWREAGGRNGGKTGDGKTEAGRGGNNWREEIRREKMDTKQITDNSKKIKKIKNLCT